METVRRFDGGGSEVVDLEPGVALLSTSHALYEVTAAGVIRWTRAFEFAEPCGVGRGPTGAIYGFVTDGGTAPIRVVFGDPERDQHAVFPENIWNAMYVTDLEIVRPPAN